MSYCVDMQRRVASKAIHGPSARRKADHGSNSKSKANLLTA